MSEDLTQIAITWKHTRDAEFPYTTELHGRTYTIRINDFPAEPLYTLLSEGDELVDLEDWPPAWIMPMPPKELLDTLSQKIQAERGDPVVPGRDAIKRVFDEYFESYGMAFPEKSLHRATGEFSDKGWDVRYRFGEENNVTCLDIYAENRRTNDRLYRVYADGRVDLVGSSTEGVLENEDRAFYAEVQRRFG